MAIQWYALPGTMLLSSMFEQSFTILMAFLISFLLTKSYTGLIRYAGFKDIMRILWACLLALTLLFVAKFIVTQVQIEALSFFPTYYKFFYGEKR